MISIQCLSNLNIGTSTNTGDIDQENRRIISFLKKICIDSELVVLNGDTFNLSVSKDWNVCANEYIDLLKLRFNVIDFIIDKILLGKIKYVVGDRDWVIRECNLLPMVERKLSLKYDGVSIIVEHGHYPDMMDFKSGIIGWPLSKVIMGIESLFLRDFDIKTARLLDMYPPQMECSKEAYRKYAHKLARSGKSNIVVLGHSNIPDNNRNKECAYVNTGTPETAGKYINVATILISKGKYSVSQSLVNV